MPKFLGFYSLPLDGVFGPGRREKERTFGKGYIKDFSTLRKKSPLSPALPPNTRNVEGRFTPAPKIVNQPNFIPAGVIPVTMSFS